jgi:hypothetical protein|tara:strand:+ start:2154 stop:2366 length:213 start_codon:yes stop_codon:yes gene_type:complete
MSKQTFVVRDGKLVPKEEASREAGLSIMRDIEPYQNMKDFGWITSRSQHREFLRRNNFVEIGNEQNHLLT